MDSESDSISLSEEDDKSCQDDFGLANILQKIEDIKRDKDGHLEEIPLFNVPTGRYVGARTLQLAETSLTKHLKWVVSLYSRKQKAFVIAFRREKYRKACENARIRQRNEKIEFLKSVQLIESWTRNAVKHLIKSLTKRTMTKGQWLY